MVKDDVKGHVPIREYPEEIRPREKLVSLGPEALSDQELLAILLRMGTKDVSALDLAQELLQGGGLATLCQASVEELRLVKGMGLAKAAQLKAALELARRLGRRGLGPKPQVRNPADAAQAVMGEMSGLDREHFKVLTLNTKNQIMAIDTVSVGSLNATLVHPREVFKLPLKRSAAAIILVHNHPSGDTKPSAEDLSITKRLREAGCLLGVEVIDHLIIGHHNFFSMKENGYF